MAEATQEGQEKVAGGILGLTALFNSIHAFHIGRGKVQDDTIKEEKEGRKDGEKDRKSLLGHFKWAKTIQQRTAKAMKFGKDEVVNFGKAGAKKVAKFAGDIMGFLKKGLGLALLWGLFKWLQGDGSQYIQMVWDAIVKIWDWLKLLFDDPSAALAQLWAGILSGSKDIAFWLWDNAIKPLWDWFEDSFPNIAKFLLGYWGFIGSVGLWLWNTALKPLWTWLSDMWKDPKSSFSGILDGVASVGSWLWTNVIEPLWTWIKLLFTDPSLAMDQLFGGVKSIGDWIWTNAILPLWNWVKLLFTNPKEAFAELFKGYASIGLWIWAKAIKPMWTWFETTFPDFSAWIKAKWAEFMDSPIGKWIYTEVLEPFTTWLGTLFTDPSKALSEAWEFFKSFGTWIFDTILNPLWTWIKNLFTNPKQALTDAWNFFSNIGTWIYDNALLPFWTWFKEMFPSVAASLENLWKGFKNIGTWIYTNALLPFWTWFEGMFPDVAAALKQVWKGFTNIGTWIYDNALKPFWDWFLTLFPDVTAGLSKLWNSLFSEEDSKGGGDKSLLGKIGGFLSDIWDWFKGLFDFSNGPATVKSLLNVLFLPHTLIVKLIDTIWGFFKGIFGFKESEAKLPKDFAIGSFVFDNLLDPLFKWLESLFQIDFDAMAKTMMPAWLYDFFSDSKGERLAAEMFKKGMMIDDHGFNSIDEDKIRALIDDTVAGTQARSDILAKLANVEKEDIGNLEGKHRKKFKAILAEYANAQLGKGGLVPAGKEVSATLHGPEAVIPLPKNYSLGMLERMAGGEAANGISSNITVNAPRSDTSVVMGVKSFDPQRKALGFG